MVCPPVQGDNPRSYTTLISVDPAQYEIFHAKVCIFDKGGIRQGGRTYVMITYVSKENNLGPDDKIRYIWGLKGPIFIL